MFQNIKVDIVYYKTNTDFEMEFNLCGCCRMRLLTDKASDKKTLVHDLARAVSRSRVIIIAGKLSGEEGIIEITARAIAKTVTEIDKSLYGIKSEDKISVINGATPLVTPDGEFGGCIIESGPQSMVLISDDKAVRKTVMNTLIHPYIEELCALDLKEKAKSAVAVAAPTTEPHAVNTPDANDISSISETCLQESESKTETAAEEAETAAEPQAEAEPGNEDTAAENSAEQEKAEDQEEESFKEEIKEEEKNEHTDEPSAKPLSSFSSKSDDVSLSGGMIFETDDYRAEPLSSGEDSELFIEPESLKKRIIGLRNHSYVSEESEDSPYHTAEEPTGKLKAGFSGNLPILIISVLLLIVLAVLCYCIFYVPSKDGVTASAYLNETFNTLFG